MNSIKRTALLLPFCLLLQGCIGAGILKSHTKTVSDPVIHERAGYANLHERNPVRDTNAVTYTSAWLEEHWGKPAQVKHGGDSDEIWTYNFRPIWKGVMPIVLIPVPIALPVGREKIRFTLRDGQVVGASRTESQVMACGAGYLIGPCSGSWRAFCGDDL